MKNPIKESPFKLEAQTKNVKEAQVTFMVTWDCNHTDWESAIIGGKNYVDRRGIPNCAGLPLVTAKSGDKTTYDWDVNWKKITSNEKEIYAVIRAEYRFIKANGWIKLHAKTNSQGIDSLFKKGAGRSIKYVIVESKCSANRDDYDEYLKKNNPHSPLGKLGRPGGVPVDGKPVSANGIRQMSDPWVCHTVRQEQAGTPDPNVESNLKAFSKWMYKGKRRMPLRYLNVYAPPKSGFYLLGGEYAVRCKVGRLNRPEQFPSNRGKGELNTASKGTLKVDWCDEPFRDLEFFALDAQTVATPGITGDFHDFAAAFTQLVARDKVNMQRAAAAEQKALAGFP